MPAASTGFLRGGVPYLRVGQGPPLVTVEGLSMGSDVPTGFNRRMMLSFASPFARHFTVYSIHPKRGLRPGESMSEIAGHLAEAIEHDIGAPAFLKGTSTGGSLSLQLAVDRPELVRRLVVVASAYRLGPEGRAMQAEAAELIRAGDGPGAMATLAAGAFPERVRRPTRPVVRFMMGRTAPKDLADRLVTLEAEDRFDLEGKLHLITAPTLVIGGGKDVLYSTELFEATAAEVRDGRALVVPEWGHVRSLSSRATSHIALGFLLAGLP